MTAVSVKRCVTGLQSQSRGLRLQSVTIKDAGVSSRTNGSIN